MTKTLTPTWRAIGALIGALILPTASWAESNFVTGATPSTQARLDFRVIIPRVLFLAVGSGSTGTAIAANSTIDLVTFDYSGNAAAVGSGAAAGSITGNIVPVRVVGNNGQISLTAATTGALSNGAGDTIAWSQITVVSSDAVNFPSPAIPLTGAGASANVGISSGTKVTNRTANWTYSYSNSAIVPAGIYGPTANSGRVTYTATMP